MTAPPAPEARWHDLPIRRLISTAVPAAVCVYFATLPWPDQDWDIFQSAARLGWGAYSYSNGVTGPLTGPATIFMATLLPYTAALSLSVLLFVFTIWRSEVSDRVRVMSGAIIAPMWGGLAAWGHVDDAFAVSLLIEAGKQRGYRRGILIGLAVLFKPWALIGVPLIWGDTKALRSATLAQLAWLPFAYDILMMDQASVTVRYGSPLRAVFGADAMPPNWYRPVELLLILAAATTCAALGRKDAVLAAALATKLLIDPGDFDYYWGPLALSLLSLVRWRTISLLGIGASWMVILPHYYEPTGSVAVAISASCVLVLALYPLGGEEPTTRHRVEPPGVLASHRGNGIT